LAPPEHQPLINLSLVGHTATCHHESQLQVAIMPLESLAVLMGQVEDLRRSLNPKEQARWVGAYDQALINARLSRKAAGGTWRAPDDQG
jgi:hypothetical protein